MTKESTKGSREDFEQPPSSGNSELQSHWFFDPHTSGYWYSHNHSREEFAASPDDSLEFALSPDDFPLWYYDPRRSLYWYFCQDVNAYFLYEENQVAAHLDSVNGIQASHADCQEWLDNSALHRLQNLDEMASAALPPSHHEHDFDHENSNQQQRAPCFDRRLSYGQMGSLINDPVILDGSESLAEERHASGWVEDFLIESFLRGYSDVHPGLISANCHQLSPQDMLPDGDNSATGQLSGSYPSAECCPVDISTMTANRNSPEEILSAVDTNARETGSNCDISGEVGNHEENSVEDQLNMDLWQAQYGQVMRTDDEKQNFLGAISLWNWRITLEKGKDRKKNRSICLVGRVAASLSRLHPSLQHHSSFIRTSSVCEVNLDLVKVSSGELYRLRQPSSKYLASVTVYDSSNPTKDWDFPRICSDVCEHFEGNPSDEVELSKNSDNSLVTKTFVPNVNHRRYQHLSIMKKTLSVPADVRALRAREFAFLDQTSQGYRDRAKERRNLYGGYGVGFGQKLSEQESAKTTPENSLSQADNILRPNSVAKRMLESMGWNEGESLGKWNSGMVEPLQVMGNAGHGGIGWTSISGHKLFKSS